MKLEFIRNTAFVLLCAAVPLELTASETLGGLKPGQHLEVWFGSSGCFHQEKYFFAFRGRRVSVSQVTEDKDGNMVKNLMGNLDLADEEIKSIDRMLVRYRNASDSGSTSTEALSVEVWEKTKRISKEVLIDGTPIFVGRAEGEIRLWDLIERVQNPK